MAALQCCTVASQWQKAMLLGQIIKTKTLDVEVPWQWRLWVGYGARLGCHRMWCMVVNDLDACRVVELWLVKMGCLRLVEKNDRSLMSVHVHDYQ